MASGTINLSSINKDKLAGKIVWSSKSNGTAANTSTVTAVISIRKTNGYDTWGTWKGSLKVGGTTKSISHYGTIGSSWVEIATVTATVTHNANGIGECYIYGAINGPTGTSCEGINVSGSSTVKLDTIPRYATITSAPNFNDEENPKITYSNPAGSSVDKLEACISLTGSNADIAYRSVSKTGNNYTFNLTSAERKVLRQATTDSNSRSVKFYLRTIIDDSKGSSNVQKTFTIKDPKPTVNPVFEDQNDTTFGLTGDRNTLVRYYSNAKVTFNAAAVKEASLSSKKVVCGTKSRTSDGNINSIETDKFVFTIKDSRGNTTTKTIDRDSGIFNFVDYVRLTCNFSNNKPDTDGNMSVRVTGKCFNGSFGTSNNSLTVKYRYREVGGSYPTSYTNMTVSYNGNNYSARHSLSGLDYLKTYEFEVVAQDALSSVTLNNVRVKSAPVFDWGENDFKFNVPVYDQAGSLIGNGLAKYGGSGDAAIDPNTTTEHLILSNHTNGPVSNTFYYILTVFYQGKTTSNNRAQLAIPYSVDRPVYSRYYYKDTWSAWSSMDKIADHSHKYTTSAGRFRFDGPTITLHDTAENAVSGANKQFSISCTTDDKRLLIDNAINGITYNTASGNSHKWQVGGADAIALTTDGTNYQYRPCTNDKTYCGSSSYKWKAVYAVNGEIVTSDRNQKKNITELDQRYIDLFDKLIPVSFEFIDKESDRVHIGFVSQDVKTAMDEVGLTDIDFAGYCKDVLTKWNEETQTDEPALDENGEPIYVYSLRYSEFIALNSKIIQNNRQRLAKQEQDICELREELNKMKDLIESIAIKTEEETG